MPTPPVPTERKRARGNPGKRALPDPVVLLAAAATIPRPPDSLQATGRGVWDRLWTAAQGWLSPQTDVDILTRLCEAHDLREALLADLHATGLMVEGSVGQTRVNPLLDKLLAVETLMTKYEGLCGFTPADRSRLGLVEVKRAGKLDDLIARRTASPRSS
jgi:P27 family predicted phage terminase small subunit